MKSELTKLKKLGKYLVKTSPLWAVASDDSKDGIVLELAEVLETGVPLVSPYRRLLEMARAYFPVNRAFAFGSTGEQLSQELTLDANRVTGLHTSLSMSDKAH